MENITKHQIYRNINEQIQYLYDSKKIIVDVEDRHYLEERNYISLVIYALSDFLIMILSWLVKQSLRAFLFQEVQP